MKKTHNCPICLVELDFEERYPNYVCQDCGENISDKDGNRIRIAFNWSGGHSVVYSEKDARYFEEFIYIDGVKCHWENDRFGRGIIIQTVKN